ncbi:hypothetical protein MRX96_043464 [Rhipicephalus microplus]
MVQYLNISTVVIIFLSAVFWRATFVRANVNHQFDFRDFLNSSEDIWTYASTWNASFICRKDNVTEITNKSVSFLTTCYENERWGPYKFTGRLFNVWNRPLPMNGMFITDGLTGYARKEIVYYSDSKDCAVIEVQRSEGWGSDFEILIKNSSIGKKPNKRCVKNFKNHSKKEIKGGQEGLQR